MARQSNFKRWCGFLLVFVLAIQVSGQDKLDSLEDLYQAGNLSLSDKLLILDKLSLHDDPQKSLDYSILLIESAEEADSANYLYRGYLGKGQAYQYKGELIQALENYFVAYDVAEKTDDPALFRAVTMNAIADVYSIQGDHENAIRYYHRSITAFSSLDDTLSLAVAELNLGDAYLKNNNADSALYYSRKSREVFIEKGFTVGLGFAVANMGMAYARKQKYDSAKMLINKGVTMLEIDEVYYPIPDYMQCLSDVYLAENNWRVSLNYALRGLKIAEKYGLKDKIADANLKISALHEQAGNFAEALKFYKAHIQYNDSVRNLEKVQALANQRSDFEIAQKQVELDLAEQRSRNQRLFTIASIVIAVLLGLLLIGLFRRYRFINRIKAVIEQEKNRSDHLLRNILPEETAEELKQHGKVKAKKYESVSVMFADFQGFTKVSEYLTPEEVVRSVDYYFSQFDLIMEKYNLEKIKTMGDAYMCAGGLHDDHDNHAIRMVKAAHEMITFVEQAEFTEEDKIAQFEIRVGINTGPVIAGVVGTMKFAYDIWGDTVNIASRMESNSLPGRINVSENTYHQIKDQFTCEFRGEIDVKNKGMMKMYFVETTDSEELKASDYQEDTQNTTVSR